MDNNYILKLIIQAQDKFSSELANVSSQIEDIQKSTKNVWAQANSVISQIKKWIVSLWLWAMIVKASKSVVELADNLEKSQIAFTTMLWSWEKAQQMLSDLSEFARKTPFELTGVRTSAQQLIAMWVNANDIIPTLKSLWDVSAWLSVPLERLALNYWQVVAQWKLTWRELRDFTMAGVPLLDELAKQVWTTTTAVQDMISKWEITADDVVRAFQNMTSEWWKFADLMWKQATTLSWMRSNFQDSLNSLWEEIWMQLLPTLKEYMNSMWAWLDNNIENIKRVAQYIIDTTWIVVDNIVELAKSLSSVIVSIANDISFTFNELFNSILESDNQTSTWVMWDRTDVFYFFQLWFTSIVQTVKASLTSAYAIIRAFWKSMGDIAWSIWSIFGALRDDVKNWALSMATKSANAVIDLVNKILDWLERVQDQVRILTWEKIWWKIERLWQVNLWWWSTWALKSQISSLWSALKENFDEMISTVKTSFTDWMNAVLDVYSSRLEKSSKQLSIETKKVKQDFTEIAESTWIWLQEIWDAIAWSWSWKSTVKKVEEMSDEMKNLIKEMNEYAKETIDMKKATYEWIIDWMENAVKTTEKLSKEIVDLNDKIEKLNTEENVDIASAYIKAEQTLKDYTKEYEDIVELAKEYSKEELENQNKDRTVNWINAKDLLEVKNAYESMQSAFEWLSEEWTQSLNEQIASQKAYNSLNSVEKIKADYEQKRKVLQDELNDKITAFETEMNKYEELTKKKENYEKEWLDYMTYSYKEQQSMTNKLIDLYNRLAEAKMQAWFWNIDWTRAWWWNVFSWNSYLVWENWPELFMPNQNWRIIPNNQITNNNWIEINMNWITVRSEADIQAIAEEITRRIKLEKDYWIIS